MQKVSKPLVIEHAAGDDHDTCFMLI